MRHMGTGAAGFVSSLPVSRFRMMPRSPSLAAAWAPGKWAHDPACVNRVSVLGGQVSP